MLKKAASIERLRSGFEWNVPEFYKIGVDVCDRIAEDLPDLPAIIDIGDDGTETVCTFGELRSLSNRIAHVVADCSAPATGSACFCLRASGRRRLTSPSRKAVASRSPFSPCSDPMRC